jgi:chromosome segregation ATPase
MKRLFGIYIKGLLVFFLMIGLASTAQAKKKKGHKHENEPYLGPTVEVCKTRKDGTETCKEKKLHGQKAIEYIYQDLLAQNSAIAANAEAIAALQITTAELRLEIELLAETVSYNTENIDAKGTAISDLLTQLSDLQAVSTSQAQDLANLRTDLIQLKSESDDQASQVQEQIEDLKSQISYNNDTMKVMLADLEILVVEQKAELDSVKSEVATLRNNTNTQIASLEEAIADVNESLDTSALC